VTFSDRLERDIRRAVLRFRANARGGIAMQDPGYAFACLYRQAFLLDLVDDLRLRLGGYRTEPTREWPVRGVARAAGAPTPAQAVPALPGGLRGDGFVIGWNAALAEAEVRVAAAFARGVAQRSPSIDLRMQVLIAIRQLRSDGTHPTPAAGAPTITPPDEPPPFTAG
jgi:hypothetical protein